MRRAVDVLARQQLSLCRVTQQCLATEIEHVALLLRRRGAKEKLVVQQTLAVTIARLARLQRVQQTEEEVGPR